MFLALFALLSFWLIATQSGVNFVLARLLPADGVVTIASVQGSVWSGIRAQQIVIKQPTVQLHIARADLEVAIPALLRGADGCRTVAAK